MKLETDKCRKQNLTMCKQWQFVKITNMETFLGILYYLYNFNITTDVVASFKFIDKAFIIIIIIIILDK